MTAYVYLIQEQPFEGEVAGPWTKIGYSQNPPEWRMDANLKRGNPRSIRVAAAFEFETEDTAYSFEKRAHEHFANRAHEREWFRVDWTEVAAWLEANGAKQRVSPKT